MVTLGYPINVRQVRNYADSAGEILEEIQEHINITFPDVAPFERKKKESRYVQKEKKIFNWIETLPFKKKWGLTAGGKYSLSLDAFTKFFPFSHDYPDKNFGAQMVRLLKTKQSLNGFMPTEVGKKRRSFWEDVGSDGRVRPYFNIYKAQSSRSQPKATGFIPLKAAWMRALIVPPKGKMLVGLDYGSQEFLLAGLEAEDKAMITAYESGDVYLWAGKQWGVIPKSATKETHGLERDKCKGAVLGIGYGLGADGLARNIEQNTGVKTSYDEALQYIRNYDNTFYKYTEWKVKMLDQYRRKGFWKLPDGWYMWGDNDNDRSVKNCPIQGLGACIMRKAVALAQDAGLNITYTLHDALYMECDLYDFAAVRKLHQCMDEAFRFYFTGAMRERANCRIDGKIWSPEVDSLVVGKINLGFPCEIMTRHIDKRAKKDYDRFSKYFESAKEIL
jgi:hypothetical protein